MMNHAEVLARPSAFAATRGPSVCIDLAHGAHVPTCVVDAAVRQCMEVLRSDADVECVTMDFDTEGTPVDWTETPSAFSVSVYAR